ncbi:SET domain protein [Rhizoctonia solani 123E]|uniref:SET domain protein n=1 Tax=Rhizoctonia solani 123E TaxID=1423351 RepID=A0A074S284_9AGAM|nr:SET domain protein [Rhizoctonia solani 123E]
MPPRAYISNSSPRPKTGSMSRESFLLKIEFCKKVEERLARTTWPDDESMHNPFVYSIEAIGSDDSTLLDKSDDGEYRLFLDVPSSHPDSILVAARSEVKRKKDIFPVLSLLTSRDELTEHYQLLYDMSPKNAKRDDKSLIRQAVMVQAPEFVRAPLNSLSSVSISTMLLNNAHQGNYLVVRAISRAVRLVAIQVMVEDLEGNVVDLALYNCLETAGLDRQGICELIPVGQTMLIREPWITRGRTGGHVTVRVDSPTDIIFLPPNHPELEQYPGAWKLGSENNAQNYKDMGNSAFKNGRFESAIHAYSCGLSVDPTASLLRLNRSICYLNINKPSMALKDACIASKDEALTDTLRSKARYRMALAYYALDQYTNALSILGDNNSSQFSPKDFAELEMKTRQRLIEQAQGGYNWFSLKKTAKQINGHRPTPDAADYVGPVKVVQMSTIGGGRGLVTTREVLAGEILIVSKPFAFASSVEYPELFRVLHARSGAVVERASYELVGRTMQRLMGDSTAASSLFLNLHSNSISTEAFRTAEIHPTFLENSGRYWDLSGEYPIRDIDVNRVEGILTSNSFKEVIAGSPYGNNEAVYLLPSMVNHACHGTAVRTSVGSIMVMRASRDLKAGEEVTCSYVGGVEGASNISRGVALKQWLITCQCELCLADQKDGESRCKDRERYEGELNDLRMKLRPGDPEITKTAKELVTKIQSTYDRKRAAPMDTLGLAQRVSGFMQQAVGPSSAIRLYTDALRSHGIHVKDSPPRKVPQNHSQLRRESLIISTSHFPSQLDRIFRCIKVMVTLAGLETHRGMGLLASHWAVACLWVHEAFYGPGKSFLWYSLGIKSNTHPLVVLLEGFD